MPNPAPAQPAADMAVFNDPASVAVVGASEDQAKWGYWLAAGALSGQHRRRVHLVNRRAEELFGQRCLPSLSDLDETPELVTLCVPAPHVDAIVDEALALGVRGFLGITTGIAEETELAARIRRGGARLLGANSLGIFDSATDLRLAWGDFAPGPLAVVSQSGQLGSELAALGARQGIGISRFVSIGNQSDVSASELLAALEQHEPTRVIALYLESFTDGELLFETLRTLRRAGKPTLLLTIGASTASARLARSHTGSLTSSLDLVDAACRAAGVVRVNTPSELIDLACTALTSTVPVGSRVAVVGDSGGQSGVAADRAGAAGLTVPAFSAPLESSLAATLPSGAACSNPVDLAGAGEQDLDTYAEIPARLLAADEIDAVVLTGYFGCYARDIEALAEREGEVARRLGKIVHDTGKPIVVHTMAPDTPTVQTLWSSQIPAFGDIDATLHALAGMARLANPGRLPAATADGDTTSPTGGEETDSTAVTSPGEDRPVAGYWAGRALLSEAGVRFPRGREVRTADDLTALADHLQAPFVLKAGWVEHKTECGGVSLGIADGQALSASLADMRARLGDGDYVVEEQDTRGDVVEILVGARRDPDLGPVVVVGAGGVEAEVHPDVAVDVAPVDPATATGMLERLRCAALLHGWRGRPRVAVEELAALVSAVSRLLVTRPDIDDIELNPVRVGPDGAIAVDALVLPSRAPSATDDRPRAR